MNIFSHIDDVQRERQRERRDARLADLRRAAKQARQVGVSSAEIASIVSGAVGGSDDGDVEQQIRDAMAYGEGAIRFVNETFTVLPMSRERHAARAKLQEALMWSGRDDVRCQARLREALFWEQEHQRVRAS